MASVTEMPPSEAVLDGDLPPEPEPKPGPPLKNKGGKGNKKPSGELNPAFFKRVASIPAEDWGTRAFMYLYITEPVCVAKTWGQYSYALKSSEPILDLEPVKQQYGSCKGYLSLNVRKSGKDATDQVDRFDFEILDPTTPPKIARGAWANDQRNDRWKALLPPEKPSASEAASTMLDAMKVYKEIRQEVKEETPAAPEPLDPTRSTLETMKLAKDLFAPKETNAAGALNPLELLKAAKELATPPATDNKMLETIVTLLQGQIAAQAEELKQLRHAPAQKGLLEQVVELAALGDKLEPVKKLFGLGSAAAETVTRTSRTTGMDLARDLGREFFQSDLARGIGNYLGSLAERNAAQNPAPMNGNGHQPQQLAGDPFQRFIREVVNDQVLRFFNDEPNKDGGEALADWMWCGWPKHFERLQNFSDPRIPGMTGPAAILTGYRNTPDIWRQIRPEREAAFAEFVNAFCEWKPPADEPAEDAEVVTPESDPVDFDAQFENERQS